MDRKIYGVFVAGGSGTRMGGDTPKQFMPLCGKPVLQRTVERFLEAEPDMKVIIVLPRRHIRTWKDLCAEYSFHCPQTLVAGGLTRFQSVRNALQKVPDGAIVAIHDGVRPFVSTSLIRSMLSEMAGGCRALVPAVPVVDTLRSTDPSVPDPDRSRVVAVQTPQMFFSEDLKKAYGQAYDLSFTDDASVVSRMGLNVSSIGGERFNIKLTVPEDMLLGEFILSLQREQGI